MWYAGFGLKGGGLVGCLACTEVHLSRNSVAGARSIYPSTYRVSMGTHLGIGSSDLWKILVEIPDQVRMTLLRHYKVRMAGKASRAICQFTHLYPEFAVYCDRDLG